MTTEELNALIAQAEGEDITAMNRLTQIYCEVPDFIDYEQAAKWFLALIQKDSDLNSKTYEKTGYNKLLYGKLKDIVLNDISENEASSFMNIANQAATEGSLFGRQVVSASPNAKSYIKKAEEELHQKKIKEALRIKQLEKQLEKLEAEIPKINFWIEWYRHKGEYETALKFEKKRRQAFNDKVRLERQLGVNN